jgi:hypothetical protein
MINIVIQKSHNNKKKYDAIINGTRSIAFGAAGYEDYTIHQDSQRKSNYIKRHSKEDWSRSNLESPAWLSRYILWEKPTLQEAIRNANTLYKDVKFHLKLN